MPEYTEIDESIHDDFASELEHLEKTTPQGTQFDGVLKGHEHRDISVRAVTSWLWGLFCFVIVIVMSLAWLFFGILHHDEKSDTIPSANFTSSIKLAPLSRGARLIENEKADAYLPTITQTPPLMPSPHDALLTMWHQEGAELNSYGLVKGAKNGRVHIPINTAMTLALQKGYPVIANPSSLRPPAPTSPALEPAEDKGF
ncbi:MAG: hypothetical protein ABI210_12465 [Abditibacteriaceae bacterium]